MTLRVIVCEVCHGTGGKNNDCHKCRGVGRYQELKYSTEESNKISINNRIKTGK
jgi:DnaJ-class molecular chaperone